MCDSETVKRQAHKCKFMRSVQKQMYLKFALTLKGMELLPTVTRCAKAGKLATCDGNFFIRLHLNLRI